MKLSRKYVEDVIKSMKGLKPKPITKKEFLDLGKIKNKNRRFGTNWAKVWEIINKPIK